jgi:hypothetical protein
MIILPNNRFGFIVMLCLMASKAIKHGERSAAMRRRMFIGARSATCP